jgi:phosphoribosylformimino-5-aminoimidazole carboxamide ribotide isomerase
MLTGPNLPALADMVKTVNIPVIASGGIANIEDIRNLMKIENLWGAITGKAIYSGSLDLKEAIETVKDRDA